MAKDLSKQNWHGIQRKEIPWFPTILEDQCIGCELCYVSCGREVFDFDVENRKARVARPYNCMVGCSTCATICPSQAITFPGRELIKRIEKEFKLLKVVRQEAQAKREKSEIARLRSEAEAEIAQLTCKMRFQIAGQFGDKKFLLKLQQLVKDREIDIINVKLEVPTVQNINAPAVMSFDVTSTQQEDIGAFLNELRQIILENQFVIVAEQKI